jgi:hypothetical protein
MPNHVTNEVTFLGNTESIKELRDRCRTDKSPFSFQAFFPRPKELDGTTSPTKIVTELELQEWNDKLASGELKSWETDSRPITKQESTDMIIKYGCDNWYDWNTKNWGTKWDCYDHRSDDDFGSCVFDTAWSTPMYALGKLSSLFKDVTIEVRYADEDLGSNVGSYTLLNGEVIDYYQPSYGKDSIKLAMDILGDIEYYLTDMLVDDVEDDSGLDEFKNWLVEIAHDEGKLSKEYALPVLEKLLELSIADELFERAAEIKSLIEIKSNAESLK